MSRIIDAICTDIDGTLLDSQRQLSQRTIAAIKALQNKIPFILASSRMPSAMTHLQAELGILNTPLICYNGGYVIHYKAGSADPQVLDTTEISLSLVKRMVALAEGTEVHVSLYNRDNWYAPLHDQWTAREEKITKVTSTIMSLADVMTLWQQTNRGAHKVMCMGPEEQISAIEEAYAREMGSELHIYRSRNTYLEIAPRAISKGSGLQLIMEKIYKKSVDNVIAFGDNYNDIELLQQAGLGVAVRNARQEVLAVANEVTDNSIDDGVAKAIEKYFSEI